MEHDHSPLVVVFGGAGYIGSILSRLLLAEGYKVRVFDNFLFGSCGLKEVDSPNLEIIEGDINRIKEVSYASRGAEAVVLLSSISGHRAKDLRWINTRNTNFFASTAVLDAAIEHGANRFIFASNASVYGLQPGIMYETSTPEPISLYSRLKLRMEERVINSKRKNFHPTVLRIGTCYGYSPRMRFDLFANKLIKDASTSGKISIHSGEQVRPLIHVEDAARAFLSCIKAHENLISGEVFNVSNESETLSVNQVANLIKQFIPHLQIDIKDQEPDLMDHHMSSTKIEKILDFKPQHNLKESLTTLKEIIEKDIFQDPESIQYYNT